MYSNMAQVAIFLTFISFSRLSFAQVGGQVSTTIYNSDPGFLYMPQLCSAAQPRLCMGSWWDTFLPDGSAAKTTAGPSSTFHNEQTWLQYSFYGTSVDIYGLSDSQGSMMIIQIDGVLQMVNTSTGYDGPSLVPRKLASMKSLDNSLAHSLSIGWSAGSNTNATSDLPFPLSFAYFTHLNVENFREVAAPTSSATSATSPSASASAQLAKSTMSTGTIAAVSTGSFAGVGFIIMALFMACRRRFQRGPKSFFLHRRRSSHVQVIVSSESSEDADSIFNYDFKARPHTSLPPLLPSRTGEHERAPSSASSSDIDLEIGENPSGAKLVEASSSAPGALSSDSSTERSSRVPVPRKAKLRLNTRDSLHLGRRSRLSSSVRSPETPAYPLTPFVVGTASIARTQTPTILQGSAGSESDASVNPGPSRKPSSWKHPRRSRTTATRSFAVALEEPLPLPFPDSLSTSTEQPRPRPSIDKLLAMSPPATYNSRPSFDGFSIMTRSVPPPYALHPM